MAYNYTDLPCLCCRKQGCPLFCNLGRTCLTQKPTTLCMYRKTTAQLTKNKPHLYIILELGEIVSVPMVSALQCSEIVRQYHVNLLPHFSFSFSFTLPSHLTFSPTMLQLLSNHPDNFSNNSLYCMELKADNLHLHRPQL